MTETENLAPIPEDIMLTARSVYDGLHANNYDADCADYGEGK